MSTSIHTSTLEKFTSFGDLLRFLRRRLGMTQVELSIAVGYSDAQISRLEQGLRLPDIHTVEARFISALCLEDESEAAERMLELAANVRREDAPALGLCPYKGLDYFDEADADLFVGREALTAKLTQSILCLTASSEAGQERFFAIVGASGSGKSSLVRAGLVPALRWDKRSANWPIHVLPPTAHPLESLADSLTQEDGSVAATAQLMDDLADDRRSLGLYIKRALESAGASYLVLVIDQFEELFSLCRSESERSCFIDNLLTAVSPRDGGAVVVITLRADFYAHCAGYPQLREMLARQQEYIGSMSDEELRRAIQEPASRGRWEFEPGLVDLILHDVGHEPGGLPLLSHALMETWQRRHGRKLTLSGYTSSGGVRGAIAETAEAVFTDQFTHKQQEIARRIFLRLTELGDETTSSDTRRRATLKELILRPEESAATQTVLKALADARLVTTGKDFVQVAHEALIREWPTLRGWLEDDREELRLHRHLTEAAEEWMVSDRETSMLYRGARLAQAREWAEAHPDDMNPREREFLEASIAISEKRAAEREAQRQRELEAARKLAEAEKQRAEEEASAAHRLRRRAMLLAGSMTLVAILAAAGLFAWHQSVSEAALSRSLLLAGSAQELNQAGRGDLALALALEAVELNQIPPESLQTLRGVSTGPGTIAVLNGHQHEALAAALSPDGLRALSGSCAQVDDRERCLQGELILWDLKNRKELLRWSGHFDWIRAVAFSSDGQSAISGSRDGSLMQWDLNTGDAIREFAGHTGEISSLSVGAKKPSFLSGSRDGTMILWDLESGVLLRRFEGPDSPITSVGMDFGGHTAFSGSEDGSLILWDVDSGEIVRQIAGHAARVNAVVINQDGSLILSTGEDRYLRLWDGQTGEVLNQQVINCRPDKLAFSQEGRVTLVSCEGLIQVWDVHDWREMGRFLGHTGYVQALDISPDGRLGISASADNTLRLWSIGPQLDYQTVHTEILNVIAIAPHPGGESMLLGSDQPYLWDLDSNRVLRAYQGFAGAIPPGAVAISPDSRYAAAGGGVWPPEDVRSLVVWELESGEIACRLEGHATMPRSLAFSPDSHMLLVGSQNPQDRSGDLIMWDVESCQIIHRFETDHDITNIVFSSDGGQAVTGQGYSPVVTLWDVSTGREIGRFMTDDYPAEYPVLDVAFGPDEDTILGSSVENLYLWDIESGKIIRQYAGHSELPWSLDVSPDGRYVVSASENGEVILWDLPTGEELYRLTAHKQPVLAVAFSPDGESVFSMDTRGDLVEWRITEKSLPELLEWVRANRYVRELTCEERGQYRVKPLCAIDGN